MRFDETLISIYYVMYTMYRILTDRIDDRITDRINTVSNTVVRMVGNI